MLRGLREEVSARFATLSDDIDDAARRSGAGLLYVDGTTGDLMVRFDNGVTKTIATDSLRNTCQKSGQLLTHISIREEIMGWLDLFTDKNEKAARDEYTQGYDKARKSSFGSLGQGERDLRGQYGRALGYYDP